MTKLREFDLIVIGAGAAGLSVTAVAAQLGLRVALIERERMGGDCLNVGCVPSKALLAAAHAAGDARRAGRFGVRLDEPVIDWAAVQRHVQDVIAMLEPADSVARFTALGATVLAGTARFTGPDRLEVVAADGAATAIRARRIVIAAGSRATVPDIPGLAASGFVTHAGLFDLPVRPEHLLILGGGAIGVEMAQAHASLGCRVTLVESDRLLGREDPELADVLRTVLREGGVGIIERAAVERVEPGPTLVLDDGRRIAGSHLLVAVGRTPNLDALRLEASGVTASARGVITDQGLRSVSNRRVYAVGDIADPVGIGPRYLTHLASHHAGVVIRRVLFRLPARVRMAALPRAIYTDPELTQVGLTEAEARAAGHPVEVLRWPLAENDRAQTDRRTAGLVKLVIGRRGHILGAGIVASHAGESIGAWVLAIDQGIRLPTMANLILPYPTRAEAAKRAAGSAYTARLFAAGTRRLVRLLTLLP